MGTRFRAWAAALGTTIAVVAILLSSHPVQFAAQAPGTPYRAPRTQDGKPNLNGIWQTLNTANWDLQCHAARAGHVVALGAVAAVPAGLGVLEGRDLPYLALS